MYCQQGAFSAAVHWHRSRSISGSPNIHIDATTELATITRILACNQVRWSRAQSGSSRPINRSFVGYVPAAAGYTSALGGISTSHRPRSQPCSVCSNEHDQFLWHQHHIPGAQHSRLYARSARRCGVQAANTMSVYQVVSNESLEAAAATSPALYIVGHQRLRW